MKKQKTIRVSRDLFISGPYSDCPQCKGVGTFGKAMMGGRNFYNKECKACPHKETFPLPPLKKKVIYLDQFVISNIMKALNPQHKSHKKILTEQPHWLEIYKKLDTLSKEHLIICPDSMYHRDESLVGEDFSSMVRVYEHLSDGVTFFDHQTIERFQIAKHFKNYIDGKPEEPLELDPEKVVHGDLNAWHGGFRVSVGHRPMPGEIDGLRKQRETSYVSFLPIFERWKREKGKSFDKWVKEEVTGLGTGLWEAATRYVKRNRDFMDAYATTLSETGEAPEVDLDSVLPPRSNDILNDMIRELTTRGITGQSARDKINEYFGSTEILQVPTVRITALLFAGIARQASLGRVNPPSRGMFNDVYAVASLLPYSDALFVDRETAGILTTNPVKEEIGCPARIFSMANLDEFIAYLDSIHDNTDPEHLRVVEEAYGEIKPYVSILRDEQRHGS
jgi:hypothetical protein